MTKRDVIRLILIKEGILNLLGFRLRFAWGTMSNSKLRDETIRVPPFLRRYCFVDSGVKTNYLNMSFAKQLIGSYLDL